MNGFPRFDDEALEDKPSRFNPNNPYSDVDENSQKPAKTYSIDDDGGGSKSCDCSLLF